ncbi:MAG: protein phosphatase 2C domain-containing protein [Minwuia sp.]|nr:protein phosphatase 2C domain-containing protein [Minwuia sp.]
MNYVAETENGTLLPPYEGPIRAGEFRLSRMNIRHAGFSMRGVDRHSNADRLYVAAEFGVIAIADGVGGSVGGEQSAQDCFDLMQEYLSGPGREIDRMQALREAIVWTNGRMLAQAWQPGGSERNPGGCCLAGILLDAEKAEFTTFHVGDSAVYLQSNARWHKLTSDHLELAARPGTVVRPSRKPRIRRAMGLAPMPKIDFATYPIRSMERLMITSDGCDLQYLADSGVPAPRPDLGRTLDESIRDLATAVIAGPLRDDSTAVMIEADLDAVD